jgi:hypothetical protein
MVISNAGNLMTAASGSFNAYVDLKTDSVRDDYAPAVGAGGETCTVSISRFGVCVGAPGIGMRDYHTVTYKDGSPMLTKDGKIPISATIGQAQAVVELDPSTGSISEPVAWLFDQRTLNGVAKTASDMAGCIIYDEDLAKWHYFLSTWTSDYTTIKIVHGSEEDKLGTKSIDGVHVFAATNVSITGATSGAWCYDPSVVWNGTDWLMAYTEVPYPALNRWKSAIASADNSALTSWARDALNAGSPREGTKIVKVNGDYHVFSTSKAVMSVSLANETSLDIPQMYTYAQFLPIPIPEASGKTRYLCMSFDDKTVGGLANTHGNVIIFRSDENPTGYEYPVY